MHFKYFFAGRSMTVLMEKLTDLFILELVEHGVKEIFSKVAPLASYRIPINCYFLKFSGEWDILVVLQIVLVLLKKTAGALFLNNT
jgi:hypothetical protein